MRVDRLEKKCEFAAEKPFGQSIRTPALSASGLEELRQTLSRTRVAVEALEERTHDFAKAALIAWESRFDE